MGSKSFPLFLTGLAGACKALVSSRLYEQSGLRGALLVIVPTTERVVPWLTDLQNFFSDREVLAYDPAEALPFEVVAANREPTAGRLRVLASLCGKGRAPVVVASAEALLPKLLPQQDWAGAAVTLNTGGQYDRVNLTTHLLQAGYERVETVNGPGQMAVRGSILDLYPFQGQPVRAEFWGDEIISLRIMDPESQRSMENLTEIRIWPAREFVFPNGRVEAAVSRIRNAYKSRRELLKSNRNAASRLNQRLVRYLEMLEEGLGGSLNLIQPYLYPEQVSLFDYLPAESMVTIEEPGRVEGQCRARVALLESDYRRFFQEGQTFTPWQEYYFQAEEIYRALTGRPVICLSQLMTRTPLMEPAAMVGFTVKEMQPFLGRPDLLHGEVQEWRKRGSTVLLLTQSDSRLSQLEHDLREQELEPYRAANWDRSLQVGYLNVGIGRLSGGFEIPGLLAVVTGDEIYGKRLAPGRAYSRRVGKARTVMPDLGIGDYVVHIHHGIGRYVGIKEMVADGRKRDYLEIVYAAEDRLYVPVDQVGLIQKYVGPEGQVTRLSRLGGSEWSKVKQRVRERVRALAQDLLKLYAERARTPGYAYSTDTVWQKEFEADFPYEETPDQQQTIADVKADMERPQPMDRLVCGDVGFGKTEVAIRAAFKAVQDGKQVAVLVPTTVLAQQHARTFKERFARYPVCIEVLSRFSSPRQQKAVVGDLSRGLVDIIIGTHRLLSADVLFKNLGLLVVDEEQRFGVGHKEMIKLLRTNVDALTLTATPIPRTLQMSLGGARDLSMIETPPQDRLPVQTYVLEFQPEVVQDAIMREIQRDGQVFYVHNRVQTISRTAAFLKKLVPQASFRVAHGQMREDELEQVMWDFLNHRFDCLICTTIIENGLDLSNVNTLIVENADQFGLAQLYQLRGRVGRSNRLAYSYFTFSRDKVLSEQAEKRLRALQEFTEFGSGFKLALRDLEIRGAGNLLGPEQHGHMAAVGFDLYNQLLQEAVQELKGEKPATTEKYNPAWELPVDTYIPDTYISDPRLKVDVYRRLAMTEDIDGVQDLALDVRDRFGPLPEPVDYLFTLHKLRVQARTLMIGDVQHAGKNLVVHFGSQVKLEQLDLGRWGQIFGKRISFSAVNGLEVRINTGGLAPRQLVKMLTQVLAPDGQVTPRECL